MATAPPSNTNANLLTTHRAVLATLTSFLTVAIHHILYLRRIYPPASFLSTRAYNYPVRQNRHPAVCTWINDAVSAISDQLARNTVSIVALCIHELDTNQVLEKWSFDMHSLPTVAKRDRDVPFAVTTEATTSNDAESDDDQIDDVLAHTINLTDLEATFRATFARLSSTSARLTPLPSGSKAPELTFTMTIELRSNADRPVGRLDANERRWIVAEPDPPLPVAGGQPTSQTDQQDSNTTPAARSKSGKTHPIRRLTTTEPSPLHIELWVEESAFKLSSQNASQNPTVSFTSTNTYRDPAIRAKEASFGAGKEKFFDPLNGYGDDDIEGNDLNRKPGGGAMTDYQRM
jgi:mitotic spindle assembly checkpoint protein MAD2B